MFLLESQVTITSPGFEPSDDEDNRSFIFILLSEDDKDKPDCTKTRFVITFWVVDSN